MANKVLNIFFLILLPIFFIAVSLISKASSGEFYLNNQYDPSYVYLLNSLNLSQLDGLGVGRVVHPGTTVYAVGAIIIFLLHSFTASSENIVKDVFSRPEFYLSNISFVFIFMNAAALFILGFVSFRRLKNIRSAIFLQFTPLFATTLYYWTINVSPEPLLIFTVILLITLIISYTSNEELKPMSLFKYALGFGLICGFGLATKISFFPLLIIPLILIKRFSFKALFCIATFIAFLLFFLPVISESNPWRFINWLKKLVLFSGKYGTGEQNVIDSSSFLKNLYSIFTNDVALSISYALISATFFLQFIPKFSKKIRSNKFYKLLIGIFGAMTIQIFIVCKHFELHYLLPVNMLLILGLFVIGSITIGLFPGLLRIDKLIKLSVIMIFVFIQGIFFMKSISYMTQRRDASYEEMNYLENNRRDLVIVNSYGASSKAFALYIGASLSGTQKKNYYSAVKGMFPENYYFDKWSLTLENVDDNNTVASKLVEAGKFFFMCDDEMSLNDFVALLKKLTGLQNVTSKKLYSNFNGETIYEIEIVSR